MKIFDLAIDRPLSSINTHTMYSSQAAAATNVRFDFQGKNGLVKVLVKVAPIRENGHRDLLKRWVRVESVEDGDIEVYRVDESGLEEYAGTLAQQSPLFQAYAINEYHKVAGSKISA